MPGDSAPGAGRGQKEVGAACYQTAPPIGILKFCSFGSPGVRMGCQSNFSNINKRISIIAQSSEASFTTEYADFSDVGLHFAKEADREKSFPNTQYLTHQISTDVASVEE